MQRQLNDFVAPLSEFSDPSGDPFFKKVTIPTTCFGVWGLWHERFFLLFCLSNNINSISYRVHNNYIQMAENANQAMMSFSDFLDSQ